MEESLGEEFAEDSVLAGMFFEAAEDVGTFVDDAGVDPGGGESAEVGAFAAFVLAVFFALLGDEDSAPAGEDGFEYFFDGLKAVGADCAVEFEDGVDAELGAD